MTGEKNEWYVRERDKRNMAALTHQFKIKRCLERGGFARMAYANYFEVNVPAKHKNSTYGKKRKMRSIEDLILLGGENDRVKTFLLWENVIE